MGGGGEGERAAHYASPVASLLRFWRRSPPGPAGGRRFHGPIRRSIRWAGRRPGAARISCPCCVIGGCALRRACSRSAAGSAGSRTNWLPLDGGTYTGFDISPKAIDWLNEQYAPRLPNFRFDLVDARNVRYRPRGADAETFRFPYPDHHFDVACVLRSPCTCSCPRSGATAQRSHGCSRPTDSRRSHSDR